MKRKGNRVWLNADKHRTAFAAYDLANYCSSLKIADCNRVVDLDFSDPDNGKVTRAGLRKLDRLIGLIAEFRAAMVKELNS